MKNPFKRAEPEPEPIRPDQVNRLDQYGLWGDEIQEHTGSTTYRDQATARFEATQRNSSDAEIEEASRRGRMF